MSHIGIIGAGSAGLAAAWALRRAPVPVTVLEKSRGFGGRAATRGRYQARYDHGAPYIHTSDARIRHLLTTALPTDDLVHLTDSVSTFDAEGTVVDDGGSGEDVYTYRQGVSQVGKLLARASSAEVHRKERVVRLERGRDGWTAICEDGSTYGPFGDVLLTPPAPQTAEILRSVDTGEPAIDRLADAVAAVDYVAQFTIVLGYDRALRAAPGRLGLRSADGAHAVARIGLEHRKPGRVPEGQSVVVVQMSPSWTRPRLEADPDDFVSDVKAMAAELLDVDLRRPAWYDTQRWRYARPTGAVDPGDAGAAQAHGLHVAGDFTAGTGRVDAALLEGLDMAEGREWG